MKVPWIRLIALLPLGGTTVLIADSRAVTRRGKVRTQLLYELSETARANGIADACIHVSHSGPSDFSLSMYGIPKHLQQRVRNVWGANWR